MGTHSPIVEAQLWKQNGTEISLISGRGQRKKPSPTDKRRTTSFGFMVCLSVSARAVLTLKELAEERPWR